MSTSEKPKFSMVDFYRKYGTVDIPSKVGLAELEKHYTVMSTAKQEFIKKIAADMAEQLKLSELDPRGKRIEDVIAKMREILPDPRPGKGNGKTWSEKSAPIACKKIADILNKNYGAVLIPKDVEDKEICEQVHDLMKSLLDGLTAEIGSVRSEIHQIMKNIDTIVRFLDRIHSVIKGKLVSIEEGAAAQETAILWKVHDEVGKELNRQLALLQNMLDTVVKPVDKDLDVLLQNMDEFKQLFKKMSSPEMDKLGRRVALSLISIGTAMEAAKLVDKALQKLGISISEYKKASDPTALQQKLSEQLQKILNKPGELYTYLKAINIILGHHFMHDEIIKELEKLHSEKSEVEESREEIEGSEEIDEDIEGGAEGGIKVDSRVKKRKTAQVQVLHLFNVRLGEILQNILDNTNSLGDKISKQQLELSDHLESFTRTIELIPDLRKKGVYHAISGFYNDVSSRQEREIFLSSIRYILNILDTIVKDERYIKIDEFKVIRDNFDSLYKMIEEFTAKYHDGFEIPIPETCPKEKLKGEKEGSGIGDVVVKGVAVTEKAIKSTPTLLKGTAAALKTTAETAEQIAKALESATKVGSDLESEALIANPKVSRIGIMLEKIKNSILYYFRTAKILHNLEKSGKEMDCYKEPYEKVLGDAIAAEIDILNNEKQEYIKRLQSKCDTLYNNILTKIVQGDLELRSRTFKNLKKDGDKLKDHTFANDEEKMKASMIYEQTIQYKIMRIDAKIDLYKVAESVDLYLCSFSNKLSKNPNDLKDLVKNLGEVEIISTWFNEKFGDVICRVFEAFPAMYSAFMPEYNRINENFDNVNLSKDHYYRKIAIICRLVNPRTLDLSYNNWDEYDKANHDIITSESLPGNPFFAIPFSPFLSDQYHCGSYIMDLLSKDFDFLVLKNIISIFSNVANRFAGENIFKHVPLSPIQIYKKLKNYIIHSSLSLGVVKSKVLNFNNIEFDVYDKRKSYFYDYANKITKVHVGVGTDTHNILNINDNVKFMKNLYEECYVGMSIIDHHDANIYKDHFSDTDTIFIMIIKSMISKILTAIGAFNMFHRPINQHGLGYSSGLRTILGGSEHDDIVISDALELYIRLPLLAEFYRELFKLHEVEKFSKIISILPEVEGTFNYFIEFMFEESKHIKHGEYSDIDIRKLIQIINSIYVKFKERKNPIRECIDEFIMDINRRYGLIKREENLKYLKDKYAKYEDKYKPTEDINFELLGIDEHDILPRYSPSSRFVSSLISSSVIHKYNIDILNTNTYIKNLHNSLNNILGVVKPLYKSTDSQDNIYQTISFEKMIQTRKEEIKKSSSEQEKFEIIRSAISNLGQFSLPILEKSLIAFHEIIVAPLNLLMSYYNLLNSFVTRIFNMYDALKAVEEICINYKTIEFEPNVSNPDIHKNSIFRSTSEYGKRIYRFLHGNIKDDNFNDVNVYSYSLFNDINPIRNNVEKINYSYLKHIFDLLKIRDTLDDDFDLIRFHLLSFKKIFYMFFETLYIHTTSYEDLVELKLDSIYEGENVKFTIFIDHSKLIEKIEKLFDVVKKSFEKFRGLLPNRILKDFEPYTIKNSSEKNIGSLYWLEKYLLDRLLHDKLLLEEKNINTLSKINEQVRYILEWLTKGWKRSPHALKVLRGFSTLDKNNIYYYTTATKNFLPSKVQKWRPSVFWLFRKFIFPLIPRDNESYIRPGLPKRYFINEPDYRLTEDYNHFSVNLRKGLWLLFYNLTGKQIDDTQANKNFIPDVRVGPIYLGANSLFMNKLNRLLESYAEMSESTLNIINRGVIHMFNYILLIYLHTIYNENVNKVYSKSLSEFINTFSNFINGQDYINDIDNNAYVYYEDLDFSKKILFRSIAFMFKQLYSRKLSKNKLMFMTDKLEEIPSFMKEKIKAYFPIISKMLMFLIRRCDLLKNYAKLFRLTTYNSMKIENPIPGGAYFKTKLIRSQEEGLKYINNTLDEIIRGCKSLIQCIKETLTDLHDEYKYLELRSNFIRDYEELYKKYAFTPLSSLLITIQDKKFNKILLPYENYGTDKFKLLCAFKILSYPFNIKDFSEVDRIFKDHNIMVKEYHIIDDKLRESYYSSFVSLVKYIADIKNYVSIFSIFNSSVGDDYFNIDELMNNPNQNNIRLALPHAYFNMDDFITKMSEKFRFLIDVKDEISKIRNIFALDKRKQINELISITESSDQRKEKRKLIEVVDPESKKVSDDRKIIIANNVIDLNIMPINIHALMREIPLINLHNYSITFDKFIQEILEVDIEVKDIINPQDLRGSSFISGKKLLMNLLIKPYAKLEHKVYKCGIAGIMRGALGIESLGRPKFIGDHLYNKSLFGEIYLNDKYIVDPALSFNWNKCIEERSQYEELNTIFEKIEELIDEDLYKVDNVRQVFLGYEKYFKYIYGSFIYALSSVDVSGKEEYLFNYSIDNILNLNDNIFTDLYMDNIEFLYDICNHNFYISKVMTSDDTVVINNIFNDINNTIGIYYIGNDVIEEDRGATYESLRLRFLNFISRLMVFYSCKIFEEIYLLNRGSFNYPFNILKFYDIFITLVNEKDTIINLMIRLNAFFEKYKTPFVNILTHFYKNIRNRTFIAKINNILKEGNKINKDFFPKTQKIYIENKKLYNTIDNLINIVRKRKEKEDYHVIKKEFKNKIKILNDEIEKIKKIVDAEKQPIVISHIEKLRNIMRDLEQKQKEYKNISEKIQLSKELRETLETLKAYTDINFQAIANDLMKLNKEVLFASILDEEVLNDLLYKMINELDNLGQLIFRELNVQFPSGTVLGVAAPDNNRLQTLLLNFLSLTEETLDDFIQAYLKIKNKKIKQNQDITKLNRRSLELINHTLYRSISDVNSPIYREIDNTGDGNLINLRDTIINLIKRTYDKYKIRTSFNPYTGIKTIHPLRTIAPIPNLLVVQAAGQPPYNYSLQELDDALNELINNLRPTGIYEVMLLIQNLNEIKTRYNAESDAVKKQGILNELSEYASRYNMLVTTFSGAGEIITGAKDDLCFSEEIDNKLVIKKVTVNDDRNRYRILQFIGMLRFDTKFIRNIFWLTNLQRILRLKMNRDLRWYNSQITTEYGTLASSITELYGTDYRHDVENYRY